jgi:hypothetical protein
MQRSTIITLIQNTEIDLASGCWEWLGTLSRDGYGRATVGNKDVRVHRFLYYFLNPDTPKELSVLHHCDNRKCCRPEHLFAGTNADNMADKVKKGRCFSKVKESDIPEIVSLRKRGMILQDIAEKFEVSETAIKYHLARHLPESCGEAQKKTRISKENFEMVFSSAKSVSDYMCVPYSTIRSAAQKGRVCQGYKIEYV